jgi:hypothetical protein
MPNPFARCMRLAGNRTAGAILYRLQYWMAKTKITRGPHKWVAMTREQWMQETCCTLDEYKRGLARLKSAGLIETEHHLFKGRRIAFMRLSDKAQECISAPLTAVQNCTTGGCETAPANKEPSVLKVSKGKGDKKVSSEQPLAKGSFTLPMIPEQGDGKVLSADGGGRGKVKSVLDVASVVKAKTLLHKPDSVMALEFVWKKTLSSELGYHNVVLTKKQIGMLKHFRGKCPEGEAETILAHVLVNWIDFVKDVEQKAGVKTTPAAPKIEFLLQHAWVAVNLAVTSPKSRPTKQEAIPGMKTTPILKSNAKQDADDLDAPQSLDELLSILNAPASKG